jgi:large subunit ribosomal protein L6e
VIATSTKLPLDGIDVSKLDDAFFSREKDGEKGSINAEKKGQQDSIDNKLKAAVDKVPSMSAFLSARFRLRKSDKPHLMKF